MNVIQARLAEEPRRHWSQLLTAYLAAIAVLWSASAVQLDRMQESGWTIAKNIMLGLVQPDTGLLFNFTTGGVLYLLAETMAIAFLGTLVGAMLAVPLAFLSASNLVPKPVAFAIRLILIVIRTIPAIVYGLMFIRVTGPGPFAGVLTMSLVSIGMLAKLYVDVIEDLNTSVLESMESIGCSLFDKIRYGIIPQLSALFLSVVIYRFDMNLRDAAILGLVGAGGIGAPLIFAMNAYRWQEAGAILIGLTGLILIVEYASNRMRSKLVRG